MKKLIALIMISTLLLSGCSLFGQANESGSLSDKLAEVEREESENTNAAQEETPASTPESAPEMPGSLTFEQLDPYDMLHNGWSLTKEQAEVQYGMEPDSDSIELWGEIPETLPGTLSGKAKGRYGMKETMGYFQYWYELDEKTSAKDALGLLRTAIDAADAEFDGRNKRWALQQNSEKNYETIYFEGMSDEELIEWTKRNDPHSLPDCSWGVKLQDGNESRYCVFSIRLYSSLGRFSTLQITIEYNENDDIHFPDDAAEAASAESAAPSEPSASANNGSSGSSSSGNSSSGGGVSFTGLVTYYDTAPYEEGMIQLVDYGATPNGSGGYNCYVTIKNGTPDMTKLAIYAWLYDSPEAVDAYIVTLAEPAAFNAGDSHTFNFEISGPSPGGLWEVLVEYRFW